jgi:tetratricopeptide (TPR) repeat protein/serine/threonine protein kinase
MNDASVSARESTSLESLLADLADEFRARLKRGEQPDVEEYAARYPEHAAVLREVLAALLLLDRSLAPGAAAPGAREPAPADCLGDFRLLREIGRGGMGLVYEAEQLSLRRRVAVKVLPFAGALDPRQLQRFQHEAQAAALLHHTNIVPVYFVGCERGVHFYAMQFIEGQTLAAVIRQLRERTMPRRGKAEAEKQSEPTAAYVPAPSAGASPGAETLPIPQAGLSTERSVTSRAFFRMVAQLGIQAAEALEHAHQLGVVHRDVKPANLLVDGRGQVWVTDFGLARLQGGLGLTLTGDLVGTLRYMSPEQALAQRVGIDHRTDVYSLGVTLYELLTLWPAHRGKDRQEVLRRIAFEDPPLPRRLNRAVPIELGTIVRKAMEKNPADRYSTAQELANDLRRFLDDKPIRAKPPSLVARLRKWAGRHKPVVVTAALGLLVAGASLAASAGWIVRDRQAQRVQAESQVRGSLTLAEPWLRQGNPRAPELQTAVLTAEARLASGLVGAELQHGVEQLRADLKMLATLEDIRLSFADEFVDQKGRNRAVAYPAYEGAFRDYGIDVEGLDPEEAAARIKARIISIHLAAALEGWALICRNYGKEKGEQRCQRLLAVAGEADPDPWRTAVRLALASKRATELKRLAASALTEDLPATTLARIGGSLANQGEIKLAVDLLRQGQQRYPADFWINMDLAHILTRKTPPDLEEAISFYRVAVALRPESPGAHTGLGVALAKRGKLDEAITSFRHALRLKPDYAGAYNNLSNDLRMKGQLEEALAAAREALRLQPDFAAARVNLANVLADKGQLDEAIAEYREALRLEPDLAIGHHDLGTVLAEKGRLGEAIAEYQEALRLKPDFALAHNSLGAALQAQGKLDQAIASYRRALRLEPDEAAVHNNLGTALKEQGSLDEAISSYRHALRLKPNNAEAHGNLGGALCGKGQLDEAITACRTAIRLKPDLASAHINLGSALASRGQLDEAITAYRAAVRLQPNNAQAHCNLGLALQKNGQLTEALAAFRRGQDAQSVRECERLLELDGKLMAVLQGKSVPGSPAERAELARLCLTYKHFNATAARFYQEAFATQPELAGDLSTGHRYDAACAAALAGCGQGKDSPPVADQEHARLRRQALDWLRADLGAWRERLDKEQDKARPTIVQQMTHWQCDPDLAGVRDPQALMRLPEVERQPWQKLWQDVQTLRDRAAKDR